MTRKTMALLLCLLFLGLFLRLYRIEKTINYDTDQAAAYILADRILNHGHILLVGPITSLWQINLLPPTYYYIVTFLVALFRHAYPVTLAFAAAGIGTVFLMFVLGRLIFDTKTGLLVSLLVAISELHVLYSRNIWEPHLIPFFTLLSLYLLFLAKKSGSLRFFILAIVMYGINLMYVASFLVLPAVFVFSTHVYRKIRHTSVTTSLLWTFSIFAVVIVAFYSPVIVFELTHNMPSVQYVRTLLTGRTEYFAYNPAAFLSSITTHSKLLVGTLFQTNDIRLIAVFFLILLPHVSHTRLLWGTILSGLFFTGLYHEQAETYRLAALFPLVLLIFAASIKYVLPLRRGKLLQATLLLIFLFLFIRSNLKVLIKTIHANASKRYVTDTVAETILKWADNRSFSVYTINPIDDSNHHATIYIHALETMMGKPLASLNPGGNWVSGDADKQVRWIFLICKDFADSLGIENQCRDNFLTREALPKPVGVKTVENVVIYKIPGLRY